MAKYLRLFETTSQYNTYINGTPDLPNVSLCEDAPTTVHYTPYVPAPSNPVIEGEYATGMSEDAAGGYDYYAEGSTTFPIIIDKEESGWEPYNWPCIIRITTENNTPLSEGLKNLYQQYGTNDIGGYPHYGDSVFSGIGLKFERGGNYDGHFQKFEWAMVSENMYEIKIVSTEPIEPGKIYYEDQSGNKYYLFEWPEN